MKKYKVTSFWVDDAQPFSDLTEKRFFGAHPAGAARKAAFQLLRRVSPEGDLIADLELAQITSNPAPVTTKAYSAHRRRLDNILPGVISFPWAMEVKAIPPAERLKNWLRRFPTNSEDAWHKRPRFGRDDLVRKILDTRTTEQILKRQMIFTQNRLTEVLPQELVLKIWEHRVAMGGDAPIASLCHEKSRHGTPE